VLTELQIENFKSLEKVAVAPKLVTVFIGPNGTGKSSIVQALALLKQSRGATGLNFSGSLFQFGDFSDVVFLHETNRPLSFSLTGTIEGISMGGAQQTSHTTYAYRLVFDRQGIVRSALELHEPSLSPLNAEWDRHQQSGGLTPVYSIGSDMGVIYEIQQKIGAPAAFRELQRPVKTPAETIDRTTAWIQDILGTVVRALGQMYFVPSNRGFDRTGYGIIPGPTTDFISSAGTTEQSATLAGSLVYKRELTEQLSDLMRRVTGVGIQVELMPGPQVTVRTSRDGFASVIVNAGFGSNQLIMLLATLLDAPKGALVAIEEPEIHLHPRAQADLAQVLVETAVQEGKQLLLTTHSEHLVIGIMTNVAAGRLAADQLALYYVDRPQFATQLKLLPVDN
jgi:energy-coupling factor transporter ATP-binding protein EcfA2